MHVYDMKPGTKAPDDRNRVSITSTASGKWAVTGSVAPGERVAVFFAPAPFDTKEAARDAALAFAAQNEAGELYVEYPDA